MKHLMWPCLPLVEFVFVLQKVNVNYVLIHSKGIANEFADYTFKIIIRILQKAISWSSTFHLESLQFIGHTIGFVCIHKNILTKY